MNFLVTLIVLCRNLLLKRRQWPDVTVSDLAAALDTSCPPELIYRQARAATELELRGLAGVRKFDA